MLRLAQGMGFFIHDVVTHPVCGVLWILGLDKVADWLHDSTVFVTNETEEEWPRRFS